MLMMTMDFFRGLVLKLDSDFNYNIQPSIQNGTLH
jgi:hypothetical protein